MNKFFKTKRMAGGYQLSKRRKTIFFRKSYLSGLEISVKGRLRGVSRARRVVENHGTIAPNTLSMPVKSNSKPIRTKWGIWNLRVHLYRTMEKSKHWKN